MNDNITTNIDKWSDEEVLENFFKFFPRVTQVNELLENDEGATVAQVLITMAGNKITFSEPQALEWPLMPVPKPEDSEAIVVVH
jgi:hypothetical protein